MPCDWHLNSDKTAAVSDVYAFRPLNSETPLGVKLLLLSRFGPMLQGKLNTEAEKQDYKGWAPCPYVPPECR